VAGARHGGGVAVAVPPTVVDDLDLDQVHGISQMNLR
jgi:hypothetical protein